MPNSPIDADGAEVEDAGGTHHHVQGDEDVTVDLTEAPLTHHLAGGPRPQHTPGRLLNDGKV